MIIIIYLFCFFASFAREGKKNNALLPKTETKGEGMIAGYSYRVFSHDVTAAILVSQNNEMAAMLVSQTIPVGVELFSYANAFFCSNKFA